MKEFLRIILYRPLFNLLIFLAWLMPGNNIGWAIIALTLVIRLALLPTSAKATRSQKAMQKLAPELEEIKKKFKDDRQGEAQATLELYKEKGISPWGSCLPLLIQLPILLVLYRVFMVGLNTARFDLLYGFTPAPDHITTVWLGIDLAAHGGWVLPVLAGLAQLLQSWQTKKMTPAPQKPTNGKPGAEDFSRTLSNQMLLIMPVFTVIIARSLPAALALYWFVTTLFMVVQTWFLTRDKKGEEVAEKDAGIKEKRKETLPQSDKAKKGPSSFKEALTEKMIDRSMRYKGRKDVMVKIRQKDK